MVITDFVNDTEKFTLDGVSSDTLGLFVDYLPPMPMAEQLYTTNNLGQDEMLTTPDKVFNDIKYVIRFYTFLADDYNDTAIKAFCANKTTLTLSRFPDYYFKIKKISLSAYDGTGYGKRIDYTLTLTLAPFRYIVSNEWIQLDLEEDDRIINRHTRFSKPIFEVTGTGDISLTIQGRTFTVTGLTSGQTIKIDSEHKIVYSGNTILIGVSSGEYPMLNAGENLFSHSGTITSIKYKGNWRDY